MAKIGALPGKAIVDAFRGTLDYYVWCNLNIVRKWPRSPGRNRSAAVVASQGPFTYINKLASTLPADVIEPYKTMASDSGLSWKDYLNRLYINASTRDHMYPAEVTQEEDMNIIWKDAPPAPLTIENHNSSIPWTALDLTAYTSVNAKFVILWVQVFCGNTGTAGDTTFFRCKNGTTSAFPQLLLTSLAANWTRINDTSIIALDDLRKIQYKLSLATGASACYVYTRILGYIE